MFQAVACENGAIWQKKGLNRGKKIEQFENLNFSEK